MAEAEIERPIVPHVPIPTRGRPRWVQGMACVAILPLLGFIGQSGSKLWGEIAKLQQDQVKVRSSEIVGYIDINPSPNFASAPDDWMHDEQGVTLLWAGWRDGKHRWFTIGRGEIDQKRITTPMGQDVVRAIDYPLFEDAKGERWGKVKDEAMIASYGKGSESIAYPLTILDKVELVNDQLGDRPVLVAYTPVTDATSIYDSVLDGQRVTFGLSGYFFGNHPILYDRGTESLWTERDGAMVAVAGRRKGVSLKLIAKLEIGPWTSWKAGHAGGRLLVGADRAKPRPVD